MIQEYRSALTKYLLIALGMGFMILILPELSFAADALTGKAKEMADATEKAGNMGIQMFIKPFIGVMVAIALGGALFGQKGVVYSAIGVGLCGVAAMTQHVWLPPIVEIFTKIA